MSRLILQLGNINNWSIVHSETLIAEPTIDGRGFRPIPKRLIPLQIEHHILVVGTSASRGIRSTWNTGGWISPLVSWGGNNNTMDAELGSYRIPLNARRMLVFPDIAPNYKLRFSPPAWIEQISIEIYQYAGPESFSTELLLDAQQQQLDRIESLLSA